MYPHDNPLKQRIAEGMAVHGLFIRMVSNMSMIRRADFPGCDERLKRLIDWNMWLTLAKRGKSGVYVPEVATAQQMRDIVAAVKYREGDNGGARGACPGIRAAGHQSEDWGKFYRWSNRNTVVVPLIETEEGVANFDEILKVPGIDWVGIGTFDLSHALGYEGSRDHPALDRIYSEVTAKLLAAGITFSRYPSPLKQPFDPADATQSPEHFKRDKAHWMKLGARVFMMGSDRGLCKQALYKRLAPMLD